MDPKEIFDDALKDVLSSNILSSKGEIRKFLIKLNSCKTLRDVVATCARGVDFREEFSRAFTENKGLPGRREKLVALITGLLYAFDTGKHSVTAFLTLAYPEQKLENSFRLFLSDVIEPYGKAFIQCLEGIPREAVWVPEKTDCGVMNAELKRLCDSIKEKAFYSVSDQKTLAELDEGIRAFLYCLPFGDNILTKNAFSALTDCWKLAGRDPAELQPLYDTLKIYGIV